MCCCTIDKFYIIINHYHYYLLGERNFSFTLVGNQDDLLFESGSEMLIKGLYLLDFELEMLTLPQLNKADYFLILEA